MANEPLVIAVDSSTSASKAVIVDQRGQVLTIGRADIDLLTPRSNHYEHHAHQWWTSTNSAIRQAISRLSPGDRKRLVALCITHQRESFVALDDDGKAIRPAVLWLDSRAAEQIRKYGTEEVHRLSGKPGDTTPALYKMIWLKENEPEVFAKAAKVVDVHAYLTYQLTGKWVSAHASADTLALFDIEKLDYSPELLELAGVRREQMADLAAPGTVIGQVKPETLSKWGLSQDINVVAGLGDGQASGLGTAAIDPDVAYINIGTSIVSGLHSPDYRFGREYRTLAAGLPGQYVLEIVQNSGSVLANWFRTELGMPELEGKPDPQLEKEASEVPIGSEGLLTVPYWNAVQSPWWNPVASGAMVGFQGGHSRAHMYRSVLEGTGYELRTNLAGMQKGAGTTIKELRATGGGSRSDLWTQILADCAGLPIVASEVEEVSAHGAAVLAMASTGTTGDIADTARAMASFGRVTEPDDKRTAEYQRWGDIQAEIYPQLTGIYERLWEAQK